MRKKNAQTVGVKHYIYQDYFKMATKQSKIDTLGYRRRALALRASGMSYQDIAKQLDKESLGECKLSWFAVRNWFLNLKKVTKNALQKKTIDFDKKAVIDTMKQIGELNTEMRDLFHKLKEKALNSDLSNQKEVLNLVKIAEHILNQLRVNAKITGELSTAKAEVNVNVIELSQKINNIIEVKRKQGLLYCPRCKNRDIRFLSKTMIEDQRPHLHAKKLLKGEKEEGEEEEIIITSTE